jgi:Tfp pilus assembly protein PilP
MFSSIGKTTAWSGGAVALSFFLNVSAFAQAPAQTEPQQPPAPGQETQPAPTAPVEPVPEGIEITEGSGFRYEASGRRDPFVSLALGIDVLDPGIRPDGLPGMLIQEVSLRGIVKTVDGYIAMIQGTDNKSYFAREGQRLYDGNIQSIDDAKVMFRQEINDPLRVEKFQTVEKTLHPVEEGKR